LHFAGPVLWSDPDGRFVAFSSYSSTLAPTRGPRRMRSYTTGWRGTPTWSAAAAATGVATGAADTAASVRTGASWSSTPTPRTWLTFYRPPHVP